MSDSKPPPLRLQSFRYAIRGICTMLRTEPNARLHALATGVVVIAGLAFDLERFEWLAIILAIALVWTAEGFNTAFEALCDVSSPDYHPQVERAKDVAAGAVLLAAIGAGAIAVLVFGRRLLLWLGTAAG